MRPSDITTGCQPRLAAGVRLKFDEARNKWTVMAPERVFMLDEVAGEILQRCDGSRFDKIIEDLAVAYDAPKQDIENDVKEMLADLVIKGVLDI